MGPSRMIWPSLAMLSYSWMAARRYRSSSGLTAAGSRPKVPWGEEALAGAGVDGTHTCTHMRTHTCPCVHTRMSPPALAQAHMGAQPWQPRPQIRTSARVGCGPEGTSTRESLISRQSPVLLHELAWGSCNALSSGGNNACSQLLNISPLPCQPAVMAPVPFSWLLQGFWLRGLHSFPARLPRPANHPRHLHQTARSTLRASELPKCF